MLAAATAVILLALSAAIAATTAPAARQADPAVFGGLGTWVDIYDGGVYAAPERTAARIAARGVTTAWVETANYKAPTDVVEPVKLGRLLDALHARGVKVVGWYLPGHLNQARDLRRARAMSSFRSTTGESFDGIALDVESTALKNVALRTKRAVALAPSKCAPRPPTPRWRSFPSIRADSSGIRRSGPGFPGPSSHSWRTRSRR